MTVVAPRWPTRLQPNNVVLATDLDGTLLANTSVVKAMTATLHQALGMGEDKRAYRTARMGMIVAGHDVARWGDDFLAAVEASGAEPTIADAA